MLTLLSGGAVAIFLSIPLFFSIPAWVGSFMLFTVAYTIYLTLRLVWLMVEPTDTSALIKRRASAAQRGDLCRICGTNHPGKRTLKVGYRRPTRRSLNYELMDVLIGEGMTDDIHLSVPICESCAKRYMFLSRFRLLAPIGLDRSFRILRRKPGYLRGLRHPFEPSNIQTPA